MPSIGKIIIFIGLMLVVVGALVMLFDRLGLHLGKLPGDIVYRRGNTTIYVPIVTSIVISLLLSALLWIFRR